MNVAFRTIEELYFADQRKRFPNFPAPYIPRPGYTDKTAAGLTKMVIQFLKFKGCQAERISNTGRVLDKRKTFTDVVGIQRTIGQVKFIPGTGTNGSADVAAIIKGGRSLKLEIKIGKDRQSPDQKKYQQDVEAAGGIYFIVRDFTSFFTWSMENFETNTSANGKENKSL